MLRVVFVHLKNIVTITELANLNSICGITYLYVYLWQVPNVIIYIVYWLMKSNLTSRI